MCELNSQLPCTSVSLYVKVRKYACFGEGKELFNTVFIYEKLISAILKIHNSKHLTNQTSLQRNTYTNTYTYIDLSTFALPTRQIKPTLKYTRTHYAHTKIYSIKKKSLEWV